MTVQRPRVVVIGGGYSGTLAANHLRMRGGADVPEITLVNPRPKFVERIRLHPVLAVVGGAGVGKTSFLRAG